MQSFFLIMISLVLLKPGEPDDDNIIKGKIIEEKSGQAVPFASIYINNTTIATISNEQGEFSLGNVPLPSQLVVSHVSYETSTIKITRADIRKEMIIRLEPRVHQMREVTIEDRNRRNENLNYFETEFLGVMYGDFPGLKNGSRQPSILNDSVLFFSRDSISFSAYSSDILKINLPVTGYTLYADLLKFEVNKIHVDKYWHVSSLTYCYFEECNANFLNRRVFMRNRRKDYYGSRMHFMRSFYAGTMLKNGFEMYEILDYEKVRDLVAGILQDPAGNMYLSGNFSVEKEIRATESGSYASLKNMSGRNFYLLYYSHPVDYKPADLTTKVNRKNFQVNHSVLECLTDTIIIHETGRIPDNSILFNGHMSKKRYGSELPENYYPNKNKKGDKSAL